MKSFISLAAALLFAATVLAQPSSSLSSAESAKAVQAIAAWLDADDFDADRLAPLVKYGPAVVSSLAAVLNAGASPAKRELQRRALEADYDAQTKKSRSKTDYVDYYMRNLDVLYRARAAQALAAIGGPEAKKALEAALAKPGPEDLRVEIQRVLKSIK